MVRTSAFRLTCGLVLGMIAGFSSSLAGQASVTYGEAIAKYQNADITDAIRLLKTMSEARTWNEANRFSRQPIDEIEKWLPQARAALLLHTEAWFERGETAFNVPRNVQFDCARTISRALRSVTSELGLTHGDTELVRDWYLLVVAYLHAQAEVGRSRAILAEARELFPGDGAILLASGSDHEMLSAHTTGYLYYYDSSGERISSEGVNSERELARAAHFYREALKIVPTLAEARLRLGRVLYRQGEMDAAARELEAVRALTNVAEFRYLANVFLGMVESLRGRGARAAELYAEAMQIYPAGQTARIGMGELAYREGRFSDAATTVTTMLKQAEKEDPWWAYLLGEFWHLEVRLAALRARVRR